MDALPRTRHLVDGQPRYTNALAHSTSPYLRQHAHNPVNWQPWGEAAFAEARRRDVPVFLSVGYATCHWCHVMEHESFEDEEVAALLNTHYVPVKVDREERPDVDAVYMEFVQLTTGHGGWPMTVWLTPEKRPLYGGTYFPARSGDRGQQSGLVQLLQGLAHVWRDPKFLAQANPALAAMGKTEAPTAALPAAEAHVRALRIFQAGFDPRQGGFTRAPKFPRPPVLSWMLRQARTLPQARVMVETTLEAMYRGGIYDHVAGGFARYSVDARWRVPHFEKTLYDNAQLALLYVEAAQLTGRPLWRQVAIEVLDYLARELSDPAGGFWSGTDADSADPTGHLHEGRFFTFTPDELEAALGPEDGGWVAAAFGITPEGDFEGRGVLHLRVPLGPEAAATWARIRPRLWAARATRPAPAVDDKVVTAWHGLAISAFARAARVLGVPAYLERARRAARFALDTLRTPDGRLHRTAWRGQAGNPAVLEDYAALVLGLLDLTEATGEAGWLTAARALFAVVERDFADPSGGWFRTAADGEALLFREKPDQDGVEPCGNSLATRAAVRLALLTEGDPTGGVHYRTQAEAALRSLGTVIERAPHALPGMLSALHDLEQPRLLVVVTPDDAPPNALLDEVWCRYLPEMAVVFGSATSKIAAAVPAFAHRTALEGRPTAYHCRGTACDLPATDLPSLAARLS